MTYSSISCCEWVEHHIRSITHSHVCALTKLTPTPCESGRRDLSRDSSVSGSTTLSSIFLSLRNTVICQDQMAFCQQPAMHFKLSQNPYSPQQDLCKRTETQAIARLVIYWKISVVKVIIAFYTFYVQKNPSIVLFSIYIVIIVSRGTVILFTRMCFCVLCAKLCKIS